MGEFGDVLGWEGILNSFPPPWAIIKCPMPTNTITHQIISLTSRPGTSFTASAAVHPAMVDPADAKDITVPFCMLPSGDEDPEAVKKFGENLSTEHHIEFFKDQVHGWMAARGDLENERVRKEYERGYQVLLDFYHKYL